MAKLSPEQTQAVAEWAAAGASLNDIQGRLKVDFAMALTYLDARMLLIECGIKLLEKPKPPEPAVVPAAATAAEMPVSAGELADDTIAPAGDGKVRVTVDQVTAPSALASGQVTFSDGKVAAWFVDQMGRLSMRAPDPGYQPPPNDIPEFEMQLDQVLQSLGA